MLIVLILQGLMVDRRLWHASTFGIVTGGFDAHNACAPDAFDVRTDRLSNAGAYDSGSDLNYL
jgi:hypothetical protein